MKNPTKAKALKDCFVDYGTSTLAIPASQVQLGELASRSSLGTHSYEVK